MCLHPLDNCSIKEEWVVSREEENFWKTLDVRDNRVQRRDV